MTQSKQKENQKNCQLQGREERKKKQLLGGAGAEDKARARTF